MKTEFKAKFLQHVAKRKREEGFTLIELLVVIIIIGILSAIALPSFLNQANKAKQSEAKQYIASINKGQQAYYAERGGFVTAIGDIANLGLGIQTSTGNYTYALSQNAANSGANAYTEDAVNGLKVYAGMVYLTSAGEALTSLSVICESDDTKVAGDDPGDNTTCAGIGAYKNLGE